MPFPIFDRSRLIIEPLEARENDLTLADVMMPGEAILPFENVDLPRIATCIRQARADGAAVILMMGAHVLRRGCARYLIDLMARGLLTHVAMNGAGAIHDFEFALIGATTESVARYIRTGQFGMWRETAVINEIAQRGMLAGLGLGEILGLTIEAERLPHRDLSLLAAGVRLGIPVTVHVSLGQDIIHQHPNCDGAALGDTSYRDFLIFAESVCNLEGGVLLNVGSAVMGPEIYLKALSMARNVAHQENRAIAHFMTAVFDLPDLGRDFESEPPKTDPRYYYRPWKTILTRTVADGGESCYVAGDHRATIPNLWRLLTQ